MTKLYILARKAHRILVFIIATLSLIMAGTGVAMKYSSFFAKNVAWLDLGLMRYLHNQLSPFFAAALFAMVVTGLYLFFFPFLAKRKLNQNDSKE